MKISIEKSKFFKLKTTFHSYVVSHNVIKTDPEKIFRILKYPIPKNIRELRSFLGLTDYYKKFEKTTSCEVRKKCKKVDKLNASKSQKLNYTQLYKLRHQMSVSQAMSLFHIIQ